jgi:Mrp family chromosome partitioning ATPase/DUF971 family protein
MAEQTATKAGPRGGPGPSIAGVRRVIAVASGKGGVGKSTVAVNLALALRASDARVGLLDADIYGPSAPLMLGANGQPRSAGPDRIEPVEQHGIKMISMGFFLSEKTPVIWRGPLVMSATKQFLRGVEWGELDYLVVDLPPGTGDIALTLAQEVPLDGGVVVTTPQDVALADVARGIAMLRQVHARVLGIIENMATFVCGSCGTGDDIFGRRSRQELEAVLGAPVIAEIPLVERVCQLGDAGTPIVLADPQHPVSVELSAAAARVRAALDGADGVPETLEPADIVHLAEGKLLQVVWTDGHQSEYPLEYLRGWCPCAECQGHGGTRHFVRAPTAELAGWEPVGRYAVCFRWQDGHATGIYSYRYLRELCACRRCKPDGVEEDERVADDFDAGRRG